MAASSGQSQRGRCPGSFLCRGSIVAVYEIVVIGGGAGTQVEIDLALSMGKKVVALPSSGGTALRYFERARADPRLRS